MELAVPIPAQTPGPVTAQLAISASSSTVIAPAATCPANRKMSSKSTGSPRYRPDGWYPHATMIVGMFSRPAAMSWPGVVLSQEARHTMPSSSAPSTATSMSLAIRSRVGKMYCPAAPALVIASDGAAVRTSNATPPASSIAAFSAGTIESRWLKHDASCEEVLTIAILGLSMSSRGQPEGGPLGPAHRPRRGPRREVGAQRVGLP